jgi:hypothetical protein
MRRTLSFLLASALLLAGLALAAFEMPSANAADPTYLRCTYTQKMPADPRRFVVLTITTTKEGDDQRLEIDRGSD